MTSVRSTSELQSGDRVILTGGIIRTVHGVQSTGFTDAHNHGLFSITWLEGPSDDWSAKTHAPADYRWDLAPMTVAQLRSALFKLEDQDAPALEALESILSTDDILALHDMVVLNA
jgi:hypothetical protein